MKSIIFAGGCFWGVQHYFHFVKGVLKSTVGYTAGEIDFPTYEQVCTGSTNHTEACKIDYDSKETHLLILLEHFFNIIDPTVLNRQEMDIGTQYRTGIYYYNENEKQIIIDYIDSIKTNYNSPIVVEVMPAQQFWDAEDYHQDYLEKNPGGYCHIGINKYLSVSKVDENARIKYNKLI